MKKARLFGQEVECDVGAAYRSTVARMGHKRLVEGLVQEAELRGAWELLARDLAGALDAITGGRDFPAWTPTYQAAGGGYEGLQAIAHKALGDRA